VEVTVDVRDLNGIEREVLLALLAHMAEVDDHIDPEEVMELEALAEDLGIDDLQADMMRARAAVQTRAELLAAAAKIDRVDAQQLIRTILLDLAQADGERSGEEQELVQDVVAVWEA
jgi:uncharacterized tellurite resistance protein B-like protein